MWLAPWFLLGGLLASLGVVLIHLMHRRRYRIVPWAAMEFLLQASRRNRRIIELRDWLLLLLRVACVCLFAIGMARPHWGNFSPRSQSSATHLIVMIDNSLSMGYKTLGKSLLDDAKETAKELVRSLSPDSRVTVIPFPDPGELRDLGVLCSRDEAQGLIDGLKVVDQRGDVAAVLQSAIRVCEQFSQPKQKRLVLISDMQQTNFPAEGISGLLEKLPGPVELLRIQPNAPKNTWIESLSLPDRFLVPGTETHFRARIRHEGPEPRLALPVQLSVRGQQVAVQTVDLLPGQTLEVAFPPHVIEESFQTDELEWLDAEISILPDELSQDDRFALVVPVFKSIPIVFVDQYGPREDPRQNSYGETFFIRKFLVATFENTAASLSLRAYALEEINRDLLARSRVVVLAGIRDPRDKLPLLSEYVRLGGSLVVLAGGDFDPVAWNRASQTPYDLLPGEFEPVLAGRPASIVSDPSSLFQIDPQSLVGEWFHIEGMNAGELADLYRSVYFFQVAHLKPRDLPQTRLTSFSASTADTLTQPGPSTDESEPKNANWLLWRRSLEREVIHKFTARSVEGVSAAEDKAKRADPETQVLARFTTGLPFVVTSSVGQGEVVLITSGISREWSTLSASYAIVVLDRMLRNLVEKAIPRRNLETSDRYQVIVDDPNTVWHLVRPDGELSPVSVGAIRPQKFGIDLNGFSQRGIHRLTQGGISVASPQAGSRRSQTDSSPQRSDGVLRNAHVSGPEEILLGIRGPVEESIPEYLPESELTRHFGHQRVVSLESGVPLDRRNREWWPWFVTAALLGLMVELASLSRLRSRNEVSS